MCSWVHNRQTVIWLLVYRKKRDFEVTNALITWACSLKLSFSCLILWELCFSSCLPCSAIHTPKSPPPPKLKPKLLIGRLYNILYVYTSFLTPIIRSGFYQILDVWRNTNHPIFIFCKLLLKK